MLFFAKRKEMEQVDFKSFFSINDAIKLEYRGKYYSSRVEDDPDTSLVIAWPAVYGVNLKIKNEDTLVVISSVRAGMHGFRGVIKRQVEGPPAILELDLIESLGKVQRRDYARVPETLAVRFRVLDSKKHSTSEFVDTFSKNISGGGMLVAVEKNDRPLETDTLEVRFTLPGGEQISARAAIVRISEAEISDGPKYEMALRFTTIHEQDRKALIKRVFAREAELRRAGLL